MAILSNAELEAIHARADERENVLIAEIERLKGVVNRLETENAMMTEQAFKFRDMAENQGRLLFKMADKYEEEYGPFDPESDFECESFILVKQAREAVGWIPKREATKHE